MVGGVCQMGRPEQLPRPVRARRLHPRRCRPSRSHRSQGAVRQQILRKLPASGARLPRGVDTTQGTVPRLPRFGFLQRVTIC